jgi:hypothetical protein
MSKVTIGKSEYEITEELMDQCQLLFYEENPRVYSILRANGTTPTQKEIEDKLTSMDHVKQLRLSIEQNGGLIDPLIVVKRSEDYVVLEGNSRLAAYRLLAQKDPIKWQKVRANVLPEEISDNDIFTLLGQYHLVGRKDWSVFEQAAYLYRQKESSKLENDILAKNVGLTEGKVNTYINIYTFMLEHDDLKPDRWSYYEEYLKSRSIRKYRDTSPQIDNTFVKQVKTGEIKQAMDVRTVLGEIAKPRDKTATKIMQDFISGKTNIYDGHERLKATGKTSNGYQKISKFRVAVTDTDFQKSLKLESTSNAAIKLELKKIKKAVEKLLKDMNQDN